jgi:hypothetical protein
LYVVSYYQNLYLIQHVWTVLFSSCLCILIFQESLFHIFFTVLPDSVIVSVMTVAAACIEWFVSVISVSFSFSISSIIPFGFLS